MIYRLYTQKNAIGFRNIYVVTNEIVDFDDKM
jgi:hypothetical protein